MAARYDRSSLRVLACVGEPLNHEAWQWYHDVVGGGRCDVVDTWWQTGEMGEVLDSQQSYSARSPGATWPYLAGHLLCSC